MIGVAVCRRCRRFSRRSRNCAGCGTHFSTVRRCGSGAVPRRASRQARRGRRSRSAAVRCGVRSAHRWAFARREHSGGEGLSWPFKVHSGRTAIVVAYARWQRSQVAQRDRRRPADMASVRDEARCDNRCAGGPVEIRLQSTRSVSEGPHDLGVATRRSGRGFNAGPDWARRWQAMFIQQPRGFCA